MKGTKRMSIIASSAIAVLACQGCVQANHPGAAVKADAPSTEKAAPLSAGMTLAAPAPFGTPQMSANYDQSLGDEARPTAPSTVIYTSVLPSASLSDAPGVGFAITAERAEAILPNIEWSSSDAVEVIEALQSARQFGAPVEMEQNFAAEFSLAAPSNVTGLTFDVGVAPRLAYRQEGELETRSIGGEVRIGQNFDERGTNTASNSWYVFAGADGEALVWNTGEEGLAPSLGAMKLRDQVTVGDMQAGVSVQRGPGQLSLSYIRREVSFSQRGIGSTSENEDFAGLSFTLRK